MHSRAPLILSVLPFDCMEEIMTYLDLSTLRALRLSSRTLYALCTGPRFKHFLRFQSIELTNSSLRSLRVLLAHPELGAAVKDLKIVATIYDQTPHVRIVKAWKKKQKTKKQSASAPNAETFSQAKNDLAWLQAQQQLQDEVLYDMAIEMLTCGLKHTQRLNSIELDAVLIQGPNTTLAPDV